MVILIQSKIPKPFLKIILYVFSLIPFVIKKQLEAMLFIENIFIMILMLNFFHLDSLLFYFLRLKDSSFNEDDLMILFGKISAIYLIFSIIFQKIFKIELNIKKKAYFIFLLLIHLFIIISSIIIFRNEIVLFFLLLFFVSIFIFIFWLLIDLVEKAYERVFQSMD